jgi:hypothetical protein
VREDHVSVYTYVGTSARRTLGGVRRSSLFRHWLTVVAADERVLIVGLNAWRDLAFGDFIAHGD